jgi:long-chain fatty acid transport protein
MFRIMVRVLTLVLCVTLLASSAQAGALYLYENGTADLGLAAAGRAASAQDASTVAGNPAGMTRLDRSQLTGSMFTMLPSMKFDRGSGTTFSGGNGFNAGTSFPSNGSASLPLPAGSMFYVHSLSEDLKLGVGAFSGAGGAMNYGKEWVGRYFTQKLTLLTATLNPGIAYRVKEWLSVGAGFSVNYALLSETVGVNNLRERLPDGRLKFKADDWAFGGNAGVLLEPSSRLRFGLTYRSQVDTSYTDRIRFTNVGPVLQRVLQRVGVMGGETTLDTTDPQTVMTSWYYALTDNSAVMGNFGWQNWQQYSDLGISVDSETTKRNIQANQHFHDTWHQAIGAQTRFARQWILSAGFAHDSAPVSKFHRTPSAPFDDNYRFGTGLQYDWSDRVTVGAAYEFLDLGEAKIANLQRPFGTLQGKYSSNYIHFVALNVIWKF